MRSENSHCGFGPSSAREELTRINADWPKAKGTFNPATAGPLNVPLPNELLNVISYGGVGGELPTLNFTWATSDELILPSTFISVRKFGGQAAAPDCALVIARSDELTTPLPLVSPINKPKVMGALNSVATGLMLFGL